MLLENTAKRAYSKERGAKGADRKRSRDRGGHLPGTGQGDISQAEQRIEGHLELKERWKVKRKRDI